MSLRTLRLWVLTAVSKISETASDHRPRQSKGHVPMAVRCCSSVSWDRRGNVLVGVEKDAVVAVLGRVEQKQWK
eukprot:1537867-Rhodomonas_salina.1